MFDSLFLMAIFLTEMDTCLVSLSCQTRNVRIQIYVFACNEKNREIYKMSNVVTYYQAAVTLLLLIGFIMSLIIRQYYRQYVTAMRVIVAIDQERKNLQERYEGRLTLMDFEKLMEGYDKKK